MQINGHCLCQGSGTSHTVYKGNKRPCPKECVLIIDHDTGAYTLERLSTHIQLKKTRLVTGTAQGTQHTFSSKIKNIILKEEKTKIAPAVPIKHLPTSVQYLSLSLTFVV